MTARAKQFAEDRPILECPADGLGVRSAETGAPIAPSSEWHRRALQMFPSAHIFGDGPFAVKLPCLRLSICLFFTPAVAEAAYRFSRALDFTCNGHCRQVKATMVDTLDEFLSE